MFKYGLMLFVLVLNLYADNIVVDYAYFRKASEYDNGTVHMFIKNKGDKSVTISKILLNDILMEDMPNELAVWYQVVPDNIEPGKIVDVMVKLFKPTNKLVKIAIETSNGEKCEYVVQPFQKPLKLCYIGFGEKYDELYFYVQNSGKESYTIDKMYLNAIDITQSTKIVGMIKINSQEKMCGIIKLKKPLFSGEYISLKISTKEDEEILAEAVVRVYNYFPIQAFGEDFREELGFDKERFILKDGDDWNKAKTSPSFKAYHIFDDPACRDAKTGILGYNAKEIIKKTKECRKNDPIHPALIYICTYEQPKNYFVYGEITDITFINPYSMVFSKEKPERDGYFTGLAKLACEPKILMTIPEAFTEGGIRYPEPEEERILVYSEIVNGSKGFWYWVKSKAKGGYEVNSDLEKEIGEINKEINCIKKYLIIGEPMNLAETIENKVEANTILCGDKAIVLILINKDYESNFELGKPPFSYKSKKDFEVNIKIPKEFGNKEHLFEITEGVEKEYKFERKEDQITIRIDKLNISKQFIFK